MNFKNKVLTALVYAAHKKVLLIFGMALLLLNSCGSPDPSTKRHLVKHKVFVKPELPKGQELIQKDTSYLEFVFKKYDLIDIQSLDTSIVVLLQYADTTNFLKRAFYDGLRKAYFNCETALRIASAQYYLKAAHPHLSLLIYDASRPQHIQQMMWDSIQLPGKDKHSYLSHPEATSLHNYGCAVDCALINRLTGEVLDMGSGYDSFEKISQPAWEAHFSKTGELSETALKNRLILRKAMKRARMNPIPTEWWHFSSCGRAEASAKYSLIK